MAQSVVKFEPYKESDDIEDYFEQLEMFFAMTGVKEDKQVAHLLTGLGAQTYATLKNLVTPKAPKDCEMERIKEVLIKHFKPKPPVIAEQFTFHKRDQLPGEPVNEFVIQLLILVTLVRFLTRLYVCGLQNSGTQKKLLAESDLTLQKAIDMVTAAEMAVLDGQQTHTIQPMTRQISTL